MVEITLVISRENREITEEMEDMAQKVLKEYETDGSCTHYAPSIFDIPFITRTIISNKTTDVIIVLGCLIEGGSDRDEVLAHQVTNSLLQLQMATGVPIASGIIGPGVNIKQASNRIDYAKDAVEYGLALVEEQNKIIND